MFRRGSETLQRCNPIKCIKISNFHKIILFINCQYCNSEDCLNLRGCVSNHRLFLELAKRYTFGSILIEMNLIKSMKSLFAKDLFSFVTLNIAQCIERDLAANSICAQVNHIGQYFFFVPTHKISQTPADTRLN